MQPKTSKTITKPKQTGISKKAKDEARWFAELNQVIMDTTPTYWGNFIDNYTSVLHFHKDHKETVRIEYYGQCWYCYPLKIDGDKIAIIWDDLMDCKFDIGFKRPIKRTAKPIKGQPFVFLTLKNDTLFADYVQKDWIREFNKKDTSLTIFPDYFVARRPD